MHFSEHRFISRFLNNSSKTRSAGALLSILADRSATTNERLRFHIPRLPVFSIRCLSALLLVTPVAIEGILGCGLCGRRAVLHCFAYDYNTTRQLVPGTARRRSYAPRRLHGESARENKPTLNKR